VNRKAFYFSGSIPDFCPIKFFLMVISFEVEEEYQKNLKENKNIVNNSYLKHTVRFIIL
jgi:hypothetical protein